MSALQVGPNRVEVDVPTNSCRIEREFVFGLCSFIVFFQDKPCVIIIIVDICRWSVFLVIEKKFLEIFEILVWLSHESDAKKGKKKMGCWKEEKKKKTNISHA